MFTDKKSCRFGIVTLLMLGFICTAGSYANGVPCVMTIESSMYDQSYPYYDMYVKAAVSGNRMYVQFQGVTDETEFFYLLQVYDISNPAAPSKLGETNSPELLDIRHMAVFGTTLVGTNYGGTQVRTYNAADPDNIVHVGTH